MLYSIMGYVLASKQESLHNILNMVTVHQQEIIEVTLGYNGENQDEEIVSLHFEILVASEEDKNIVYNGIKDIITLMIEEVSWHECTHDEPVPQPCIIAERYVGEGSI